MKLFLASFLQKENFGPGRIIGITDSGKPNGIEVKLQFKPLTPPKSLVDTYNQTRPENPKEAGEIFVKAYTKQLEEFLAELEADSKEQNKPIVELLPFKDGDTLASWERAEFTNYRRLLAPFLEKMGYEVVLK